MNLSDVTKQFNEFFGVGGTQPKRNGESDTERVRAQVAGKSAADPTHTPTSRGLDGPAKEYDPPTPEEVAEAFQFKYGV